MCVYIYLCVCVCVCVCACLCVLKSYRSKMRVVICSPKDKQFPSQLLPIHQWHHGNSCTCPHNVWLQIAGTSQSKVLHK